MQPSNQGLMWCSYPGEGAVGCPSCDADIEAVIVEQSTQPVIIRCPTCRESIRTVVER